MMSYREDDDPWYIVQTNTGTGGAYVDCMKFTTEQEARATLDLATGRVQEEDAIATFVRIAHKLKGIQ